MHDGYCGHALQVNAVGLPSPFPSSLSASLLPFSSLPPFPLYTWNHSALMVPALMELTVQHVLVSIPSWDNSTPSVLWSCRPQGCGCYHSSPPPQGPSPYRTLWATQLRTPLALPYAAPNASPQILQVLPGIVKSQATWLHSFHFTRAFQIGFGIKRLLRDAGGLWEGHM